MTDRPPPPTIQAAIARFARVNDPWRNGRWTHHPSDKKAARLLMAAIHSEIQHLQLVDVTFNDIHRWLTDAGCRYDLAADLVRFLQKPKRRSAR